MTATLVKLIVGIVQNCKHHSISPLKASLIDMQHKYKKFCN